MLTVIVVVQLVFGSLTLITLAPIIMQVGHLLLADLLWIFFILLSLNFLSRPDST
jgi:heme A synthase